MNKDRQLDDFFGPSPSEENNENKKSGHGGIRDFLVNENKSIKARLKILPKVLSSKERYAILFFLIMLVGSVIAVPIISYYHFTTPVADYGGTLKEGVIGEPRHINPLLAQSDADRDIVKLIYSGLLKYNEDGKLVPDLARSYDITSDELNYTIYLKDGAKWHDGEPVTVDDVIFTIQTVLNPDYGSPQRINWQGVEIEKVDDLTVVFKLKNKYAQFLNNLTLPIIPKHLWNDVKPINFALSELNIKPIGTGPYKFNKLQKDTVGRIRDYELVANDKFYNGKPLIQNIHLKFYGSEDDMIAGYNKNEFNNLGMISPNNLKKVRFKQRLNIEKLSMPRYFGVFFNQSQSKIIADKNVRMALAYGTDRESLIRDILDGNGTVVDSPIMPSLLGNNEDFKKYSFDKQLALDTLNKAGWDKKDENGILMKGDTKLSIKLTTSTWPELIEVANNLKQQWQGLGVDVVVETLSTPDLQQVIKDRNYQMLLFGEIINLDPDPFSLWHSSQKRDPGLNLALYDNSSVDTLLEDARKTLNPLERAEKYNNFQKIIADDIPVLFLYSPYYLYGLSKDVKGFENTIIATPSERFLNVENWYISTKRIWSR